MSAVVEIETLVKNFGARRLLDIQKLVLEAGRIYALTGDNGSGKSTLLRILAGLEPANDLQFRFFGGGVDNDIDGARYPESLRREIVYVHQHPYLFNTSVAANIDYGLAMRGVDAGTRAKQCAEAITWAGLTPVAQVPPKRLSGGEKQKVALARAKVLNPKVLLVDEPTANLDRSAREQIVALLRATASENNVVVVACHDREIIDLPGVVVLHLENAAIGETVVDEVRK
jgi:tungstate transport system ATP-binding protein